MHKETCAPCTIIIFIPKTNRDKVMDLKKAKVLVTGGSSGIGLETARSLVQEGAQVIICGRNRKKLEEAALITGAKPVAADVSNPQEAFQLVKETVEYLGDYNVLINNAGFGTYAPLVDLDPEAMRRVWETNVLGAMLIAQHSARFFKKENYGHIVNVASTASQKGYAGGTAYASSKFALAGMTQCWREELRRFNIRVMQINPSEVVTPFYQAAGVEREDNPTKLHAEDIAHVILNMLKMEDRGFSPETTIWATNPRL